MRPSLIDAQRAQVRIGERAGLWFAALFKMFIPRRYRPVQAGAIAACLLNAALENKAGEHVIESDGIHRQ